MSRCADADDLWRWLDGELPAARARVVAGHVAGCRACGVRARGLRAMLEACRAAGCQRMPAALRTRARARVRALLRSGPQKR